MNVDQKSLETEFSIVICRQTGDKWQIENTVSIDFWSAFVDCEERFRLQPTRCEYTICLFGPRFVINWYVTTTDIPSAWFIRAHFENQPSGFS